MKTLIRVGGVSPNHLRRFPVKSGLWARMEGQGQDLLEKKQGQGEWIQYWMHYMTYDRELHPCMYVCECVHMCVNS